MKRDFLYKGYKIVTYTSGNGWYAIYNALGHRVGGEFPSLESAKTFIDSF